MTMRVPALGCLAAITLAMAAATETAARGQAPAPAPSQAPAQLQSQRALLDRYCVGCHNQRSKAAGQEPARKLTLDDLDVARIADHPDLWERVARKMRAGMMPPAG